MKVTPVRENQFQSEEQYEDAVNKAVHGSVLSCPQASSPVDASLAQPTIPEVTEPQPLALFDIVQELYLRVGGGMGRRHTRPIAKVKSS